MPRTMRASPHRSRRCKRNRRRHPRLHPRNRSCGARRATRRLRLHGRTCKRPPPGGPGHRRREDAGCPRPIWPTPTIRIGKPSAFSAKRLGAKSLGAKNLGAKNLGAMLRGDRPAGPRPDLCDVTTGLGMKEQAHDQAPFTRPVDPNDASVCSLRGQRRETAAAPVATPPFPARAWSMAGQRVRGSGINVRPRRVRVRLAAVRITSGTLANGLVSRRRAIGFEAQPAGWGRASAHPILRTTLYARLTVPRTPTPWLRSRSARALPSQAPRCSTRRPRRPSSCA